VLVANVAAGGKLVLMHKWDAERALELIERERVTNFGGVPAMVWQVIEHPDFARYDISSLKAVGYGGAPAAPELVRKIDELFPGRTPSNGYGLTETSSVTTMNGGVDYLKHPDSVGVPVPVCDVKVVDPVGKTLSAGEVGELWIRGPNVVRGYWNKPEATAETFRDGWMHTGDVAREDEDGFWYIVDRTKDMIVTGGFNVFPREVEDVVAEHPSVAQVCVIGTPDEKWGEAVTAVVVLRPDAASDDEAVAKLTSEIQASVKDRKGSVQSPKQVIVVDTVPVTALGKPDKKAVRAQFWEGADRAVG